MQVIFTVLLITLFNHRNFAAGTAFSKTEVLQAAIFEALIIGEIVNFQSGTSYCNRRVGDSYVCRFTNLMQACLSVYFSGSKQSLIGLAAGAFLGLSTVCVFEPQLIPLPRAILYSGHLCLLQHQHCANNFSWAGSCF